MHSTLTTNANVFSLAPLLLLVLFSVHLTNANPVNHTSATTTTTTGIEYDNATIAANVSTEVDESTTDANSSTGLNASPVSGAEPPLRKCEWTFSEQRRNKLFFIGQHELVFHVLRYIINKGQRRCYVTRNDLESKLDASVDKEVIVGFAFACRDLGTELIFLENEEAEQLSGSSPGGVEDQEAEMNDINVTQGTQYRFYPGSISYFQSQNCRIHAKAVWMVGNMTDFRVFTAIGERAVDLAELENGDRYCEGFRNLVSFSIVNDWTLQDNLHYLTRCKGYLDNVVEMELYNNSLTSFPDELRDTVPNLGSLQVQKNHLTSPVEFPWKPGFVALPRNLSRTYQFNSLYNYRNSFDMQPNLFRKILILSMNNITNLTHFQFSGEFQYIKLENNSLREISDDVFDNVPSLQFLSLAHNELQNIPEDLFSSMQSLTGLDLQGNKLTRLPNDTFRNVRSLETLNLQDNQLEVLQDGLFTSLRELKNVMLKNNNLMTVSDGAFSTLSVKLTSIDLQHNPLIEVPPIVFLLRGLKNINLEHTDIEVLDFTEIDLRTDAHALINALKNPTTGEVLDNRDMPESQKFLSLRFSRLRSIVIYNVTEETGATFLLIIKHFTIYTEGSKLACNCNILNVTHFLEKLISDDKLLGTEACLSGWRCIWPDELSGKPVVDLLDNETYCPLEDDGKVLSCPDVCTCYVRTGINTVIVDCKDAGLKSLPEIVPVNTTELWLQNNTIQTVESRPYLKHILTLNLTSNNIKGLPVHVLKNMTVLKELDLKDNWLTSLAEGFADLRQLEYVRLSGNPFRCDCHTKWMKSWLLENQGLVKDWTSIKCSTDESEGKIITAVPDREFICKISASLAELAVPIAVPVGFFLPILAISVVAFLQRRRLKVWLYIHTGLHPFDRDPPDDRALYDVTVCCSVSARAWILRNVVEPLENEYKYKVFFYSRDSFVGFTISENVRHCVKNSRRLVVVLGKNWDKDDLLVSATREALARCRKDMVHFMTVLLHQIVVEDIDNKDIQQYTRRRRYIHTDDKHFLKKLVYEMPHLKSSVSVSGDKENTKVADAGLPEHVALHDIVAAAEKEQKKVTEKDDAMVDRRVFFRQISGDSGIMDLKDNTDTRFGQPERQSVYPRLEGDGKDAVLAQNLVYHRQRSFERYSKASAKGIISAKSVFVWYSDVDLAFTLKAIVEPLEKLGHVCILQDRDFPLGAAIQENIVHAAETCTRCVLILSDKTARDEWFTFTFHVTFDRQLQSRDHRVALVKRDDVDVSKFVEEIQQTIKSSALLTEDDPWFWKRLLKFVDFDGYDIC